MILAARVKDIPETTDEEGNKDSGKPIIHRELKTKEDIKNYIKGII